MAHDSPRRSTPVDLATLLRETMASVSQHTASPEEIARRAAELKARERAQRADRVREAMRLRNIPNHRDTRLAVYAPQLARTTVAADLLAALSWRYERRLRGGEMPGLLVVLAGPNGCGKTVAACWTVARWPRSALYVSATEFGHTPDSDYSAYVEVRQRWLEVDLLVVNDLGAEKSRATQERIEQRFGPLLLERYELGRATVVTTNLEAADFCEVYLATQSDYRNESGAVKGNAWLASRLSREQAGGGMPYWFDYPNAPDLRDPSNAPLLAGLPRIDPKTIEALR